MFTPHVPITKSLIYLPSEITKISQSYTLPAPIDRSFLSRVSCLDHSKIMVLWYKSGWNLTGIPLTHANIGTVLPWASCIWRNTTVLPIPNWDSVFNEGDSLFHKQRSNRFPYTLFPDHRKRHVIYVQPEWLDWMTTTYDPILRKLQDMNCFLWFVFFFLIFPQ